MMNIKKLFKSFQKGVLHVRLRDTDRKNIRENLVALTQEQPIKNSPLKNPSIYSFSFLFEHKIFATSVLVVILLVFGSVKLINKTENIPEQFSVVPKEYTEEQVPSSTTKIFVQKIEEVEQATNTTQTQLAADAPTPTSSNINFIYAGTTTTIPADLQFSTNSFNN